MRGIKIPQQDFARGAYARGGAYLRDTTVCYWSMVGGGHREANKISHLLRNCHTLCSWVGFLDHLFFNLIAMLTYLSVSTTTSFSSNPCC